jgi:hypothetical protein
MIRTTPRECLDWLLEEACRSATNMSGLRAAQDMIVESNRPCSMASLGLDYKSVWARNLRVIYNQHGVEPHPWFLMFGRPIHPAGQCSSTAGSS